MNKMADEDGNCMSKEVCSEAGIETDQGFQLVYSKPQEKSKKREQLESWLNKLVQIKISDGRTLIGAFMCTDRDRNIILGSCQEFVGDPNDENEDPRILGLAMVPGKHIVSIEIDMDHQSPHMFKPFH